MPPLIGQSLGRYHILEQLGEGGMATVYKAYDTRLEADVAVKFIRLERLTGEMAGKALIRFEREAKALARLTHPNIVKVIDYGEHENQPYLVMEYLPGGTLKQMLGKPMDWQEAIRLLLPICRALEYAHQHGIIHRDVKPSNILITESGEPMLTDFGVAKLFGGGETEDLTGTGAGMGVGTPEYMAPENVTSRQVDERVDIYALGVVLYELVAGRKPYTADTPVAVLFKHASEPLPPIRDIIPALPEGVEAVIIKALAKQPANRHQGMRELHAEMARLLEENIGQSGNIKTRAEKQLEKEKQQAQIRTEKQRIQEEQRRAREASQRTKVEEKKVKRAETARLASEEKRVAEQKRLPVAIKKPALARAKKPGRKPWIPVAGGLLLTTLVVGAYFLIPGLRPEAPAPTSVPLTATPTFVIPTPLATYVRPADGMTMVYVPAGEFTMGSDAGDADEQPVHAVSLDAYWIDQTEVTNAMYEGCVTAGICQPPTSIGHYFPRTEYYGNAEYADYPVDFVSWENARTYCEWTGARLPTEAEWEKAARGVDGRTYPWGEQTPTCDLANFGGFADCGGDTRSETSHLPGASPYGALEMAGNVWEWVGDWYGAYPASRVTNPTGPESGDARVIRGGSWQSKQEDVRTTIRTSFSQYVAQGGVGFRCARAETSAPGIGSTQVRPADGMTMVYVPAGEFTMGSDAGDEDEQPVHTVSLDAYWIDRTEVTNAMYEICVGAGICPPHSNNTSATRENYHNNPEYASYPVVYVDWNEAQTYCSWAGGRLPTEAEWEKAARGIDGRNYPWGNDIPTCSLTNSSFGTFMCVGDTSEVGSYPLGASPYGALDQAGNVWEWVTDWYDESYYFLSPDNPLGPSTGDNRVLRGGSWTGNYYESETRSTNRIWNDPAASTGAYGFRCARSETAALPPTSTPTDGEGQIAFISNRDGSDNIYVMAADGSDVRQLTNDPAPKRDLSWLPDGAQIAFASGNFTWVGHSNIYVTERDGSAVRQLTDTLAFDENPIWSPDGMQIAFTSNRDGSREIYVMDADGSNVRRLTNNPAIDVSPAWSPDGTQIAFMSSRDGSMDVYVMQVDGSNITNMTNDPTAVTDFAWSPDGTQVAFTSKRSGSYQIYIIQRDGSDMRLLTDDPGYPMEPVWSPDGTQIVFVSNHGYSYDLDISFNDIFVINSDGSDLMNLTNGFGDNRYPIWSPDGAQIAFISATSRDSADIYVVNTDGSELTRLTNDMAVGHYLIWMPR